MRQRGVSLTSFHLLSFNIRSEASSAVIEWEIDANKTSTLPPLTDRELNLEDKVWSLQKPRIHSRSDRYMFIAS